MILETSRLKLIPLSLCSLEGSIVDKENYLYYTYWQIIDKRNNRIMGTVGYKGVPDINGEIEVGYGLNSNYRGFGYMTEALLEFINWAFTDDKQNVQAIIARTLKDNIPSQKVLKRLQMSIYNEDEECFWFRKDNDVMNV